MLANTALSILAMVCSAVQATAIPEAQNEVRSIKPAIATDNCEWSSVLPSEMTCANELYVSPDYACNCPNNCSYRVGHSCKYWAPNGKDIISGSKLPCHQANPTLTTRTVS